MMRSKAGFTLIELLIVVLIILMLSGLLFRIGGLVGDRSLRAKAMTEIQNLKHALNEYFAEYGTYPPIRYDPDDPNASMRFTMEHADRQPDVFRRAKTNDPDNMLTDSQLGYEYGLVSYLFLRDNPAGRDGPKLEIDYDEDTARDVAAKQRWANYLKDIELSPDFVPRSNNMFGSMQSYSNMTYLIMDPWNRAYRYDSRPPHLSFNLWSAGPSGEDGTADDIGTPPDWL